MVTVGRTDWSLWRPILDRIRREPTLSLRLYATGSHLSPEFGLTIQDILRDGYAVDERVEMLLSSDAPQGMAKATGLGVLGFAQVFERAQPDLLLVLGDRFETLGAVCAAAPFRIPVAHVHGGEVTEGLVDELYRHAITKMSHLHCAATEEAAARIRQMGEEPWRVQITGAPGIDAILSTEIVSRAEFCAEHGLDPRRPFLLVTYHPVTLELEEAGSQVRALLEALQTVGLQALFTYPNADAASRSLVASIRAYATDNPLSVLVASLGRVGYPNAMRHAAAMVGNSSSGLIEAASLRLPVVNIGNRQRSRLRARNVIDCGYGAAQIAAAIRRAVAPAFRASLKGLKNPYGDGKASERIVRVVRDTPLGPRLITKVFSGVTGRSSAPHRAVKFRS